MAEDTAPPVEITTPSRIPPLDLTPTRRLPHIVRCAIAVASWDGR
jgi:hypothetical protein